MENASKALLIAADILMAILVVSIGMYAYNDISEASQTAGEVEETEQLAKFNAQYEAFNRDGLTGFEMITLINKAIDYNIRNAQDPDKNYPRIDVRIELNEDTAFAYVGKEKGVYDTSEISDGQFRSKNVKNDFFTSTIPNLESTYGKTTMTKYVSILSDFREVEDNKKKEYADNKMIDTSKGMPSIEEIEKYEAYLNFKREENFNCKKVEYDDRTGRIKYLRFKQE